MLHLVKNGTVVMTVLEGSAVDYEGIHISPATVDAMPAVHEGNTYTLVQAPPEPEPEPPTPEELRAQMPPLTPRQFRDALIDHDIMPDDVTAAINQIADAKDRAKALNAWEYPTQFVRTEPLIEQIGAIFSLTPEDIDDMWRQATA
ncbi:hypothetical protein [Brucella gallinifaecis]|uniref:hypothetical protein n=1 Tax=Brucella gallinifaecis TaxID=215590 RepID=UPI002360F614|nr:hypothetical protein [Brucella gallinifaecis]